MTDRPSGKRLLLVGLAALITLVAGSLIYRAGLFPVGGNGGGPGPESGTYRKVVSAFFAGVAALDADANDRALDNLSRAVELAPDEPAAWANLGLVAVRGNDYESAVKHLEQARALAPENADVERLLGLMESRRGQSEAAVGHLRRAAEFDPDDARTLFTLGREIERLGLPDGAAEARRLMERVLAVQPQNLAALIEHARLSAKEGDGDALRTDVGRLSALSTPWPPLAKTALGSLEKSAAGTNPRSSAMQIARLRNVLVTDPSFRRDLNVVETPAGVVGEPIRRFLVQPMPDPTPSPPDESLAFTVEPVPAEGEENWDAVAIVRLNGEPGPPALFVISNDAVRRLGIDGAPLPFPGGPPKADGLLAADWNSDQRIDLAMAGADGPRLFSQAENGSFTDVTPDANLPAEIATAPSSGIWAADFDSDGDLDLVVGATDGPPFVLRNSGSGPFDVVRPFEGASDLRGFAWFDLDQDGLPDASLLDGSGTLRVFTNERSGRFRERSLPDGLGGIAAITAGDLNGDGLIDLVAWKADGGVIRLSETGEDDSTWNLTEVVRSLEPPNARARLFVADLDNNGALDLIVDTPEVSRAWLGAAEGYQAVAIPPGFRVTGVGDLNGDGQLDLAGISESTPARAIGKGSKAYHWQVIRPQAATVVGDNRINSFGVGGEAEVRSGLLVQKQVITGPWLHFGLGDHEGADVARVVWPNGTVLAEFETKADQALLAEQRLKGSCPFVFADDGHGVRFVTDFLWRSPLGLRINAQDTAGAGQTEDWIKIRGDQLAPREGFYDVRITADLWETHYFDHVSLMVVDHPTGTEVFVDERFARNPPALKVHATGPLLPVARARDDQGADVTEIVRSNDHRYLDTFGRGHYQGVTRDHWVEVELAEDTPRDRPLVLVARGWIHPTDSSINVALAQSGREPPQGLVLEVPTDDGGWKAARPDLGFPAGKDKTILVDLDGVFQPDTARRFRLRTNLEVFWDSLAVAVAEPDSAYQTQRLMPDSADLRYRGFSLMTQADPSSPELPDYSVVTGTTQRWRDLVGFYTRFGDIKELLDQVDDRYAIVNAGDEVAFRFPAPPPPVDGFVRDFVLIGDGWNKDGDFNTAFSETVLPLPSHARPAYDTPAGLLEDDPVYQAHPDDWVNFHTRYIIPGEFRRGLRPSRTPEIRTSLP